METKKYSCDWIGRTLIIETGKLANQATGSVTVRYGDTVILATVVQAKEGREGLDFFPLLVGYEEKLYAAGIIKGSRWIKREGRPTDNSILVARMIDRAIRPLFNQEQREDVQVILTVLSVDQENDPEVVSFIAASAALAIAGLEWKGPISGIKVGRVDNKLVFNPTLEQEQASDFDLMVAGTKDKIIMVEAGAKEVPEAEMFKAMEAGLKELQAPLKLIEKLQKAEIKEIKKEIKEIDKEMNEEEKETFDKAQKWLEQNTTKYLFDKKVPTGKKQERKAQVIAIKEALKEYLAKQGVGEDLIKQAIDKFVDTVAEAEVTRGILERDERVDGRKLDEIRPLSCEISLLPRTHGSSLFNRGETQVLSIVTLGSPGDEQMLEGLEGKSTKKYMHHYNFPPYSVGEVKPNLGPSRRDIGHGALAEKALKPVLPPEDEFVYTIRVVSEVLGSNGSSSMGATCGSSLSLMDAGVPIKKAVAGVAMGLASTSDMKKWKIITDIQDLEDGEGGMDFKVAGTEDGITAIQMDTKTSGLPIDLVKETLGRAKKACLEMLKVMNKAIAKPRPELSKYAPRILSFKIDPERIGEVIGAGGKIINGIIKETEVDIDISDEGMVSICSTDAAMSEKAAGMIKDILREFQAGEEYSGKVARIMDFGIIVELPGNHDGMVHVSEMAPYRVGNPGDILKMGDEVAVRIKEVEESGRISLTMKGLETNQKYWEGEPGKDENAGMRTGFGSNRFGGGNRFNSPRPPRRGEAGPRSGESGNRSGFGDRGGRGGRPRQNDDRRNRRDGGRGFFK